MARAICANLNGTRSTSHYREQDVPTPVFSCTPPWMYHIWCRHVLGGVSPILCCLGRCWYCLFCSFIDGIADNEFWDAWCYKDRNYYAAVVWELQTLRTRWWQYPVLVACHDRPWAWSGILHTINYKLHFCLWLHSEGVQSGWFESIKICISMIVL